MKQLLYFAYGSNLHPGWLRNRVPSAQKLYTATLFEWQLHFHKISKDESAKCNIVKTGLSDDSVHGVIYQFDPGEKYKLDKIELDYHPELMTIGEYENVLVYLACEENINDTLLPYTWYKDIVISGAELHNLPGVYIEYLRSFNAITDPDQEREKQNRRIASSGLKNKSI